MDAFRKIYPEEYYRKFLEQNVRPDGRGLTSVRKTVITLGSLNQSADGSSFVKIGSTTCVCGIRAEIGQSKYSQSSLALNVELSPLCSSKFIRGRPSEQAQVVAQSLNSLVKNIINLEELKCNIVSGGDEDESLSWYLWVDVCWLDYDGNIFDAAIISAIGALKNLTLPNIKKVNGLYCYTKERPNSLTLDEFPLSLTFSMMDRFILCDPTFEEENLQSGTFTIVVNQSGEFISISKPNGFSLDEDQVKGCLISASTRASQIVKYFENSNNKQHYSDIEIEI
jgi:exosome complex component RRP43